MVPPMKAPMTEEKGDRSVVMQVWLNTAIRLSVGCENGRRRPDSGGGGAFPREDGRTEVEEALSGSSQTHRGGGSGAARGNIG